MADTAETVVVEDLATALEVAMAELVVVAAGVGSFLSSYLVVAAGNSH